MNSCISSTIACQARGQASRTSGQLLHEREPLLIESYTGNPNWRRGRFNLISLPLKEQTSLRYGESKNLDWVHGRCLPLCLFSLVFPCSFLMLFLFPNGLLCRTDVLVICYTDPKDSNRDLCSIACHWRQPSSPGTVCSISVFYASIHPWNRMMKHTNTARQRNERGSETRERSSWNKEI
jgi:hypothetical protein